MSGSEAYKKYVDLLYCIYHMKAYGREPVTGGGTQFLRMTNHPLPCRASNRPISLLCPRGKGKIRKRKEGGFGKRNK